MYPTLCFNPHPTFLPGDAFSLAGIAIINAVSIHTRHFCRVMRAGGVFNGAARPVSIHTRHFCRVMRLYRRGPAHCQAGFNPHPTFLPGDAGQGGGGGSAVKSFQSTPDISAG